MFENGIERTMIITAVVLWFAHGWYLNERLKHVHKKPDRLLDAFDRLRDRLYEIAPQFNDECESRMSFQNGDSMFAEMNDTELMR